MRPWVAPFGNPMLAAFLSLNLGLRSAGELEYGVEGTLADAAAAAGDISEPLDLVGGEITGEDETGKGIGNLFVRCLLQGCLGSLEVEPELINRAPVRITVNPWGSVRPAHDAGLAYAVLDSFKRVGEGSAFEAVRICQNVCDGAAGQLGFIEREDDIGKQDARALALDDAAGSALIDTCAVGEALALPSDEFGLRLCNPRCEPGRFLGAQLAEF